MGGFEKTTEIKHFMTKKIVWANHKDTVFNLCKIIARKKISCIVIKNRGKLCGIITERDIVKRVISLSKDPKRTKAESIMSRPIIYIDKNKDLIDVWKVMKKKKVRRLIVKSNRNKIEGIITLSDIVKVLFIVVKNKTKMIHSIFNRSQQLFRNSINALFQALDAKDHYTGAHSRAVAGLCRAMCKEMKFSKEGRRSIYLAGLFHDIGKIYISDKILKKKGPLEANEYAEIKQHPLMSEGILKPVEQFKRILSIIRHHHEWYNGKGYPDRLKGSKIPFGSMMINIADSYNAMRTNRPYRKAMDRKRVIGIVKEMSGVQFDPKIVKIFLKVLRKNPSL